MSYTSLQYHIVFSTKDRRPMISPEVAPRLFQYIGGVIGHIGGTPLAVNGQSDHVHIATLLTHKQAIMDALRIIKCNSSAWIHDTFTTMRNFTWQEGFAAFSVSQSAIPRVIRYISGQDERHKKMTFQEELISLLKRHKIEYDERYIWA